VCVRGDIVMQGYWRQPEATAAAIRDGWLYTGDIGRLDEEGYLTLLDRSKDLIISGGSNIYPREVEEVLLSHPAVHEASVIGRRDDEWGEVVVAYIVTRDAIDADTLDAFCREHIARFKRPKMYRFVDALPKNHYGKVLKTELREREAQLGDAP
jgi:long-chain acyl-CoA synthetase